MIRKTIENIHHVCFNTSHQLSMLLPTKKSKKHDNCKLFQSEKRSKSIWIGWHQTGTNYVLASNRDHVLRKRVHLKIKKIVFY